jgi:DNA-binding NtrC family response regulator
MKRSILICDDEKNIQSGLAMAMELDGYEALVASNGKEGWELVNKRPVDLVITDLRMPKMGGEELLRRIVSTYPRLPVIILTGHGTIETAVEAMRSGAIDFFTKPVDLDRLSLVVKKALSSSDLYAEHERLKAEVEQLKKRNRYDRIVGKSQKMVALMDTVAQVASTKASVLVTGESGVGKELVADAIHELSTRADKPLIKVHCAALSASLLESELFGHEKGSFTGAVRERKGRFELADGGTIFLDEIGEIDMQTQVKLLRVLQERTFERVGGEKPITVDVRIVCATNKDLLKEVEKGNFREDLYYRLNVVHLVVPPLRERKEDIPLLLTSFLTQFSQENNRQIEGFSAAARRALLAYDWPGNIRELRNSIESAVVLARTSVIEVDDLPPQVGRAESSSSVSLEIGITLAEAERRLIISTLAQCGGNKTRASEVLGIGRKTLHRKLQEYHIDQA